VDDEVLAGFPSLVGVVSARVYEGLLHPIAIHDHGGLIGVLLHDGEQVTEEPALDRGELGSLDGRLAGPGAHVINLVALGRDQRGRAARTA
jgi:hypothetical protein